MAGTSLQAGISGSTPKFLSIAQIIANTGISRSTVHRHLIHGTIPCTRIGKRVLIPASFLTELLTPAQGVSHE